MEPSSDLGVSALSGDAVGIAVTGMLIVFTALAMLSLFIATLPRILEVVARRFPEPAEGHGHGAPAPQVSETDDERVLAAIGFVLHMRHRAGHKLE